MMRGSPVLTEQRFAAERQASPIVESSFTVGGAVFATAVLFVLVVVGAAFGWSQVDIPEPVVVGGQEVAQAPTWPGWVFLATLVGLAFALVTIFRPKLARFTAPIYALSYGVAVGAISALYDFYFEGIVAQAVLATIGVFAGMLFLYATRIIKVTNRFVMVVAGATMGIFLMYLVGWVASLFGADLYFWNQPTALGIGISIAIVIVAALNLAIDFAFIEGAAQTREPKYMEWYAGFGVTVTMVWLYLEMLRLLALLRQN